MKTSVIFVCVLGIIFVVAESAKGSGDEILDPGYEFMKASTDSILSRDLDGWENWSSWIPPQELSKMAPVYKAGYDFDGLPVYVLEYGKWNYRALAHLPDDEMKDFDKYMDWNLRHMSRDASLNRDQGIIFISDLDGFALESFASSKAFKLALKSFTAMVPLNQVIKHGYHINTNFAAETFINVARPFMGNLFEKLEVYGTRSEKWKPILLAQIPRDQLPPQLGGTEDWKPVPLG